LNDLVEKPSFFSKFSELLFFSIEYNNKIIGKDPLLPKPSEWPFLRKGIYFWGSKDKNGKLYLVGNIVTWHMTFFSVPVFILLIIIDFATKKRGIIFFDDNDCKFLYSKGVFFLIGYLLHYLPFFLMGRALYLHHYLPAFIFNVFVFASTYEILSNKFVFMKRTIFTSTLGVIIFSAFVKIAPLSYGFLVGNEYLRSLKLFPDWNFI
jgi:dolichyl-phosphate-mannose-protein mannosyltransferase